ncbi:maleylpyruvate isomerase N-terminal domain-containing protein [Streptomyces sp. NPDC046900]|uniref:maleylpyruvate isomerase N-terminal domain-containing protein n=1 Tax=Streptomyces sp. NPDC046900 TaxID=3155473 RepID=UPI0033D3B60C
MNQLPTPLPLAPDTYLAVLREEVTVFERLLRTADPGIPVATCGSWSLHDLATHMGHGYRSVAAVVRTGELRREQFAPAAGDQLAEWYAERAASLLATLEGADPAPPCWAFGFQDAVTALWFRPETQDTAVHLVDAQLAAGAGVHVDPLIAADGVDEVFATLLAPGPAQQRSEATAGAGGAAPHRHRARLVDPPGRRPPGPAGGLGTRDGHGGSHRGRAAACPVEAAAREPGMDQR